MKDENELVECPNCKRRVLQLKQIALEGGAVIFRCGECKLDAMKNTYRRSRFC